jgi:hypothetical protein
VKALAIFRIPIHLRKTALKGAHHDPEICSCFDFIVVGGVDQEANKFPLVVPVFSKYAGHLAAAARPSPFKNSVASLASAAVRPRQRRRLISCRRQSGEAPRVAWVAKHGKGRSTGTLGKTRPQPEDRRFNIAKRKQRDQERGQIPDAEPAQLTCPCDE